MTRPCLNPDCTREVDTIGVCVTCSNGDYAPKKDGVSVRPGLVTEGWGTQRPGRGRGY